MITKKDAEYIFKHLAYNTKNYDTLGKEFGVHKTTLCKQMKEFKKDFHIEEKEKYCAYTYLRYFYGTEIINKYVKELRGTEDIIKDYNLSDGYIISKILKYYNVDIRSRGYISKTDQKLFNKIEDEITAYVLGLITADGNVGKDYSINIHLTENDKYLLEQINKRLLNNTGHILISPKKDGKPVARLSFNGKEICKNLEKFNIIPNKSKFLKEIQYFDEPFMQHYLRGLYDGDGVCSKNRNYLRIGYCAYNKEFTESYQNFFVNKLGMKKNKLFNTGSCWDCSWGSKEDLIKFYNYIYKDSTIFLIRKKDKLFNYLYGNTEVTR